MHKINYKNRCKMIFALKLACGVLVTTAAGVATIPPANEEFKMEG